MYTHASMLQKKLSIIIEIPTQLREYGLFNMEMDVSYIYTPTALTESHMIQNGYCTHNIIMSS